MQEAAEGDAAQESEETEAQTQGEETEEGSQLPESDHVNTSVRFLYVIHNLSCLLDFC